MLNLRSWETDSSLNFITMNYTVEFDKSYKSSERTDRILVLKTDQSAHPFVLTILYMNYTSGTKISYLHDEYWLETNDEFGSENFDKEIPIEELLKAYYHEHKTLYWNHY